MRSVDDRLVMRRLHLMRPLSATCVYSIDLRHCHPMHPRTVIARTPTNILNIKLDAPYSYKCVVFNVRPRLRTIVPSVSPLRLRDRYATDVTSIWRRRRVHDDTTSVGDCARAKRLLHVDTSTASRQQYGRRRETNDDTVSTGLVGKQRASNNYS